MAFVRFGSAPRASKKDRETGLPHWPRVSAKVAVNQKSLLSLWSRLAPQFGLER